jgi:ribosome biogenesis GTPase A
MGGHSDEIEKYYKINVGGSTDDLIEKLGKKKNFLKKGGKIDIDRTARFIIRDWQSGAMRK